ncbi:MAG: AAA family ATPase, partial [Mucispirillum sp.]|nr:AAA family ATPase [Mucispirillum sp.]
MKLKLKNIGKLQETEIDIDGITVIAGKNNTGKSTVGKSLYCIFSSMYDVNQKIEDDKKDYVRRRVEILFMQNSSITNRLLF